MEFFLKCTYERNKICKSETHKPLLDWFAFPVNSEISIDDAKDFIKNFIPSATGNKILLEKIILNHDT